MGLSLVPGFGEGQPCPMCLTMVHPLFEFSPSSGDIPNLTTNPWADTIKDMRERAETSELHWNSWFSQTIFGADYHCRGRLQTQSSCQVHQHHPLQVLSPWPSAHRVNPTLARAAHACAGEGEWLLLANSGLPAPCSGQPWLWGFQGPLLPFPTHHPPLPWVCRGENALGELLRHSPSYYSSGILKAITGSKAKPQLSRVHFFCIPQIYLLAKYLCRGWEQRVMFAMEHLEETKLVLKAE